MAYKIYSLSADSDAFNPVLVEIDKIALQRGTSRSDVMIDMICNSLGIKYERTMQKVNRSNTIKKRLNS